jgi:Tat protein translocase TatB subunit
MTEILIIAGVALVIMGPEKFPEFAKIAMRAFRDFRGYIDDIKREMAEELRPVKKEINQLARYNPEEYIDHLAGAVTASLDDETPSAGSSEESPAAKPADAPSLPDPYAEGARADGPSPEPAPDGQTPDKQNG